MERQDGRDPDQTTRRVVVVRGRVVVDGRCVSCGVKVVVAELRDELSHREFGLSGFCQECQDEIFKPRPQSGATPRG